MPRTRSSYNTQLKKSRVNIINYKLSDKKYEIPFTDETEKKDINVYIDPYKEHKNRSLNNKKYYIQNYEIDRSYVRENALNQLEKNKNNLNSKQYKEAIEEIDNSFKVRPKNLYKEITKKLELYKYILPRIYSRSDFDTKTFIDLVNKNTTKKISVVGSADFELHNSWDRL
ncbi:23372_t:CDS:2 [Gigaspora rosea]|nr:23372_t:CDS:2 [Gigaspora rosea]